MARARRYGSPLSLLMLDIDDFKRFNDLYGHQLGDEVLRLVARVLQAQLRQGVDILARYGGEEFAVILPNTAAEGAADTAVRSVRDGPDTGVAGAVAVAPDGLPGGDGAVRVGERLRQSIEAEFGGAGSLALPEQITMSVGVAQLADGVEATGLVAAADAALYQAKRLGKNRVCSG